eukprot:CAMPEP_0174383336 /NCGR_PEP_ID=MMETSP0811_2-20130205/125163_1 /TAXON_ID=73025 ORGANISM="Eutreptiella gymnastica-like, Strain CCMP1594" /NCGR_SAMPLE_ID=MMETSP0811_2 /ASSEMBLY_ACC=CAM_ASM_000667 /LENGTH=110 /DNA_ID=CAMNT_0015536877 /DNA_START=236 /DNA_END=568 /DNA_ORIENTATION=+
MTMLSGTSGLPIGSLVQPHSRMLAMPLQGCTSPKVCWAQCNRARADTQLDSVTVLLVGPWKTAENSYQQSPQRCWLHAARTPLPPKDEILSAEACSARQRPVASEMACQP